MLFYLYKNNIDDTSSYTWFLVIVLFLKHDKRPRHTCAHSLLFRKMTSYILCGKKCMNKKTSGGGGGGSSGSGHAD